MSTPVSPYEPDGLSALTTILVDSTLSTIPGRVATTVAPESRATTRVAVVGAETPPGGRIREALAGRKFPGERVDLYGARSAEPVLSEYDGEARLIQEPDPSEVGGHDLIVVCEGGEATRRALSRLRPEGGSHILLGGRRDGDHHWHLGGGHAHRHRR